MPSTAILIVANPFEARVVTRAVEQAAFRAVVAEGGEGAVAVLEAERPRVIVLAQGLYDADDLEVLEALRARAPRVPVLLVRDRRTPDPRLVADDVLGRPINPTQLVDKLRRLAQEGRAGSRNYDPRPRATTDAGDAGGDEQEGTGFAAAGGEAEPAPASVDVVDEPGAVERAPRSGGDEPVVAETPSDVPPARRPLLRMDDALTSALADALFPVGAAQTHAPGPPVPARSSDHLGLDSLPGIDAELGLGPATADGSGRDGAAAGPGAGPGFRTSPTTPTLRLSPLRADTDPAPVPSDLPASGDLADDSLPALLVRLHRAGYTGRLTLARGEAEKSIYFDGGFVVFAESNLPHERLGELLWREGKITRDQHARCRQLVGRSGHRVGEVLIEINALKNDELFKVLRHQAEEIIYACFGWERGAWRLGGETAARDQRVSVPHPYALTMEGIRRKYGLDRLLQAVGPMDRAYAAGPSLWAASTDAMLSSQERDATQLLRRGARTVAQLQEAGKLDRIGVYALVQGLLIIGGVTPAAAASDEAEARAEGAVVDRERALAKHAQVLDGDYFSVLGVTTTASAYEIRRAWERMRGDFALERFDGSVRAELADKLAEIREVVDEAGRALSDEQLRESYRRHLPE